MVEQKLEPRRQNIEQQRGKQAWYDILEIKKSGDKEQKEYRSLARGLNAMIQINGLGQTLGFLKAKGKFEKGKKNAHFYLLEHLRIGCTVTLTNKLQIQVQAIIMVCCFG